MARLRVWISFWSTVAALTVILLAGPTLAAKEQKAKTPESKAAAKVELNLASQGELEKLPGVGEATAKKIIAGRPYASVGDLSKAGVSAATIKKLTPLVTVGTPAATAPKATKTEKAPAKAAKEEKKPEPAASAAAKVNLNTATQQELEALSGVGPATAKKIIAGRPYASVGDLSQTGVPAATIKKLTPLVTVGTPAATAPKATKTEKASAAAQSSAQAPAAKGMVWVNTESKVFHREGDRWYGKTKQGKYMAEADAVKEGYRESKR